MSQTAFSPFYAWAEGGSIELDSEGSLVGFGESRDGAAADGGEGAPIAIDAAQIVDRTRETGFVAVTGGGGSPYDAERIAGRPIGN